MKHSIDMDEKNPQLPGLLTLPISFLSSSLRDRGFLIVLNKVFSRALSSGELGFLANKNVCICVIDAGVKLGFSVRGGKLIASNNYKSADILLEGSVYDYMLLASRNEDVDTLFFRRRLRMQGDTELGLQLKNFLDAVDVDENRLAYYLSVAMKKSLPLYMRMFG